MAKVCPESFLMALRTVHEAPSINIVLIIIWITSYKLFDDVIFLYLHNIYYSIELYLKR